MKALTFSIAWATGSGRGPLFPIQVIQPYPTISNLKEYQNITRAILFINQQTIGVWEQVHIHVMIVNIKEKTKKGYVKSACSIRFFSNICLNVLPEEALW